MSRPEDILLAELRLALGRDARHSRLFRNPCGTFWAGKLISYENGIAMLRAAQRVECGLTEGAGDLIGWSSIVVTPEMVGQRIAVFTSGETKIKRGKKQPGQPQWHENVLAAGGRSGFIYSVADGLALVAS